MSQEGLTRSHEMSRRLKEYGVSHVWELPPEQRIFKDAVTGRIIKPDYGLPEHMLHPKKADMKCLCIAEREGGDLYGLLCGCIQSVKNDVCEKCGSTQITMFDASTDKIDWILEQAGWDKYRRRFNEPTTIIED